MDTEPTPIINPEIPETPTKKHELLRECLAVIAVGGQVEGVTAHHVTSEGAMILGRAIRGAMQNAL